MTASIDNWNVDPNQVWYVKIGPSGGQGLVELFNTAADAQAGTNRVAHGTFSFGSGAPVTLTDEPTPPTVQIFNEVLEYHLKATLLEEDPAATFRIGPFTDLPEVSSPLLSDADRILDRARREIDQHTHTQILRDVSLAVHYPDMDVGDVVRITDSMRSLDVTARIDEIRTSFDKDSLLDTFTAVEFKDVVR